MKEFEDEVAEPVTGYGVDDNAELEEGYIVDLITGEQVKLNELEQTRQEEERKLLEDILWNKKLI
jgi:hypothetical protein